MKVNSRMNMVQFRSWLEEQGAWCEMDGRRLNCVIDIDHIEPGLWAAITAVQTSQGLTVTELVDYFSSAEEAWDALDDRYSPAFPPQLFKDWVGEQYLTDKKAAVEKLEI